MSRPAIGWTPAMDDAIRSRYRTVPGHASAGITSAIAAELRVRDHNVRQRARTLGLSVPRHARDWTDREKRTLELALAAGATHAVIAEALKRSAESVKRKALSLGLRRHRIPRERGEYGFRGLLTLDQVRALHATGSLPASGPGEPDPASRTRTWSRAETDFLLEHVGTRTLSWIARKLGRSVRAIEHKCHLLGAHPSGQANGLLLAEVRDLTAASTPAVYQALAAGKLTATRAWTKRRRLLVFDEDTVLAWKIELEAAGWETSPETAEYIRREWPTTRQVARQGGITMDAVYAAIRAGLVRARRVAGEGKGRTGQRVHPRDVRLLQRRGPGRNGALERILARLEPHLAPEDLERLQQLPRYTLARAIRDGAARLELA